MKKIPLNSLVLDFRTDGFFGFHEHEIVSLENEYKSIIGDDEGYFIHYEVLEELRSKIKTKLWIGERVVVKAAGLRRYEKEAISRIAQELNLQVFYLISSDMAEEHILKGDGLAEVVVDDRCAPVQKLTPYQLSVEIKQKYSGITVIGDVHGQLESVMSAIHWAQCRNNYIIFLGDIIDFGPKSLECVSQVYNLCVRGLATFLIGNHERKIYKWLNKINNRSIKIYLSEANKTTIDHIKNLSLGEKRKWEVKFRTLMHLGRTHLFLDNLVFVHASYNRSMDQFKTKRTLPLELEKLALFGETKEDLKEESNHNLSYDWVEKLPSGLEVFIGHDAKSNFKPFTMKANNSTVYFMDTDSGKGGVLSSADLHLVNGKYIVQNFNQW